MEAIAADVSYEHQPRAGVKTDVAAARKVVAGLLDCARIGDERVQRLSRGPGDGITDSESAAFEAGLAYLEDTKNAG